MTRAPCEAGVGLRTASSCLPAGSPSTVTRRYKEGGESEHYFPQFLPGGKKFLFLLRNAQREKSGVFLGSLDGKPATLVFQTDYQRLGDSSSGRLLSRKPELHPPRVTGDPEIGAESVKVVGAVRQAAISVAGNGVLLYGKESPRAKARFAWRDRSGKVPEMFGPSLENASRYAVSLDGGRVAFEVGEFPVVALWVYDVARGVSVQMTFSGDARDSQWSADGKHLYYYRNSRGLHRRAADGSGEEEIVVKKAGAYSQSGPDGGLVALSLTGERKEPLYLPGKSGEYYARFSSDGRWVTYSSDESGRSQIYIQGFPDRRADGKELYWMGPEGTAMAASVELAATGVRAGRAETLFQVPPWGFAPSRDGKRFLVLEPEGGPAPPLPLVIVQNWAARLAK